MEIRIDGNMGHLKEDVIKVKRRIMDLKMILLRIRENEESKKEANEIAEIVKVLEHRVESLKFVYDV